MKNFSNIKNKICIKLHAFGLHLLITLAASAILITPILLLWYPSPFAKMQGGFSLLLIIIICDLVLGPLISLIIYNPKKTKKELILDYTIIGIIQLAFIAYGLHSIAMTRPVFVALTVDRFEIVSASELEQSDLEVATKPEWQSLSWTGPKYVWAVPPTSTEEHNEVLFGSLSGKDLQHYPRYYDELSKAGSVIAMHGKSIDSLRKKFPDQTQEINNAVKKTGIAEAHLKWLPARFSKGFATALVNTDTSHPVGWLYIDPY